MVPVLTDGVPVHEVTTEDGHALAEAMAQELPGMSAQEFAICWDEGRYRDTEDPKVIRVAMLLPFMR